MNFFFNESSAYKLKVHDSKDPYIWQNIHMRIMLVYIAVTDKMGKVDSEGLEIIQV